MRESILVKKARGRCRTRISQETRFVGGFRFRSRFKQLGRSVERKGSRSEGDEDGDGDEECKREEEREREETTTDNRR